MQREGEWVAPSKGTPEGRRGTSAPAAKTQSSSLIQEADATRRQPTPFGRVVRMLRSSRGLSQAVVARQAGISPGYVGLLETGERGERPSLDIVKRIGQAVGATVPDMEELLRTSGHLGPDEQLVPDDRQTFAQFIDSDPWLSRDQKETFKFIYRSWVGQGTDVRPTLRAPPSVTPK